MSGLVGKSDIDHVRESADLVAIIAEHVPLRPKGREHVGLCPFHDDTNASLGLNTEKNLFNCFACDAQGNILDFVMMKEDLKPRPAGIKLAEICGIPRIAGGSINGKTSRQKRSAPIEVDDRDVAVDQTENVDDEELDDDEPADNKPLTFELKLDIQPYHPWLESRGITPNNGRIATSYTTSPPGRN